MIPEYAGLLAGKLSFDRALSERVRREVEDHLWETVEDDSCADRREAERRAVAAFGDPGLIAAQFAVVSLTKRARRMGLALVLVIAGIFVAMKARLQWYAVTQWTLSEERAALGGIVGLIDKYAFWLAVTAGVAAWVWIATSGFPRDLTLDYRDRLRRFLVLSTAATGAVITSVVGDGVLTLLRLAGTEWSAQWLIPVASMAIELVCAGVLAVGIRGITQRVTGAARLVGS